MHRRGVGGSARYQRTRNHHHDIAFLRVATLQRHLFADAVEIIGRGDFAHQTRFNPFAEDQLTFDLFVVVVSVSVLLSLCFDVFCI